jgi:hypothetical protein
MRFTRTKHRLFVLCAGFCGFTGIALANTLPPIWFPTAAATQITSWTDVTNGVGLYQLPTFSFQFNFLGINYTSATLSSNGLIYLDTPATAPTPPAAPQAQPTASLFLQQPWPSIAPAWYGIQDIDQTGESVLVQELSNQVVITFMSVGSYPGPVAPSDAATFQVSLDSDGSIIFAYQNLNSIGINNPLLGSSQAIVGVTGGFGASDSSTTLSGTGASPVYTPGFLYTSPDGTVYQNVVYGDNSNFAGLDLIFTPETGPTWQVTSDFPGDPSPEPATLLEITASAVALYAWRSRNKLPPCGRL